MNNTKSKRIRYVVLPPEASTNFLFDENILFNLLTTSTVICMDRSDVDRYKRLAARSDVDFLKYFLLTLLFRSNFIRLLDYKAILSLGSIEKSLRSLSNSKLLFDTERHHKIIYAGYERYLQYIANKENIFSLIGNSADEKTYQKERIAAKKDLSRMLSGSYDEEDRQSYLRRLSTKLMAAQNVCNVIGGTIFDSREYQQGTTLLRNQGLLPSNAQFEVSLFTCSKAFDEVLKFCEKQGVLKPVRGKQNANGMLRIWLPYAILETLSHTDQHMVSSIQQELIGKSQRDLEDEVEEWLQNNRKGLGGLESHRHAKEAMDAAMGLIPIIGQTMGIYKIIRSLYFMHSMSKIRVSNVAELIGVATASELGVADISLRYKLKRFWIKFFYKIFKTRPSEDDDSWKNSQREMGAWTDTELYVPWYEHSEEKLKAFRLATI